MEILKFITAGSVDDGKSTLIGRLLYDSKSILVDQLEVLKQHSKNKNNDGVDLAILTDGLRSEREQGITIDVAYRYFATEKRKFIIADAPGHVQYTRNMITGASNSELMIILIDARQGVIEQTRRHSIIASLLNLKHIAVAINKMDLVDYSQEIYENIKTDYLKIAKQLGLSHVEFFPISALDGDNIVEASQNISWYQGPTLLSYLENVEIENTKESDARFQVQYVIRPQSEDLHDYRGYAGSIISGSFKVGDEISILPSQINSKISKIEFNGSEIDEAVEGQPVVLHITDDIDISRGDFFSKVDQAPKISQEVDALVCWMDQKPLQKGNKYVLQHHSRNLRAIVQELDYKVDVNTLNQTEVEGNIGLNDIVKVKLKTAQPFVYEEYKKNKTLGSAILIDESSNTTAAACIIV